MPKIVINKEASDAIRGAATLPFKDTSRHLPDGRFEINLDEETFERLAAVRQQGESMSDALIRIIAFYKSQGKSH